MNLTVEDYSERAIAVFGETKGIRTRLAELGGKFNPGLRGVGESKRPGWIFPKKQQGAVQQLIQTVKSEIQEGTFVAESVESSVSSSKAVDSKTSVPHDKLSAILSRLELVETKLAGMEKLVMKSPESKVVAPSPSASKSAKDWADYEEEEEEPKAKPERLLRKR